MTDLTPLCALGAADPRRSVLGALTLTERPDVALASLALRRGMDAPAPFGLTLPQPGRCVCADGTTALWTGPGQWMIAAEGAADTDFAAAVLAEAPGASVTEQTDGWVCIDIRSTGGGAPITRLLEKLVNLPPEALREGCAARAGLHHLGVFVMRHAEDRLTLLGMRSAAGSLWHALSEAASRLEIETRP